MANSLLARANDRIPQPHVRHIGFADLQQALKDGADDFMAMPSHLVFLALIYPILGICLAALTFSNNALPLIYPLATGFALIGPFAAIGLYEVSRRREAGVQPTWRDAFEVLRSPALPSIAVLGLLLALIFLCWLGTARLIYGWLFGPVVPTSLGGLLSEVLTTSRGWTLIIVGNLVGFIFAALVLSVSVVAFPLLLDRNVGVGAAIQTSMRVVAKNPVTMGLWGLIVAVALAIGSLPLFVGLALVMPILGHSTWHLYRRTVGD